MSDVFLFHINEFLLFFHCAHSASQAGFYVSKEHIRKCGCRAFPNGKISCRSTLFRGKHVEMQDLVKCFCSKTNRHKFPEFRAACTSWHPFLSTPL
ncbi:hypothetical protein D9C73_027375 [Xyrichtys novacula]|uniref:Secreted protein n=1 Tax=Xyrichtys novacula TaxID=13765 RepID=A0AAV1HME5_XYRNO|nr:hypothetical protein D9C73_027375 [Xyrichtys novacula]